MVASVEITSSEAGDGEMAPFVCHGAEAKSACKTFSVPAHEDASTERGGYNSAREVTPSL